MKTSDMIGKLKKIKRNIPLIQIPCEIIWIARHHGMGAVSDLLFFPKPRALRKMTLPPMEENVLFSVVVPLYETNEVYLRELIEAVQAQEYKKWELCLVDASRKKRESISALCNEYTQKDSRVRYISVPENKGISANTDYGIRQAKGEYIALCDHDDILLPKALYMMAAAIQESDAEVFYSDEDHLNKRGKHIFPLYKPDWS